MSFRAPGGCKDRTLTRSEPMECSGSEATLGSIARNVVGKRGAWPQPGILPLLALGSEALSRPPLEFETWPTRRARPRFRRHWRPSRLHPFGFGPRHGGLVSHLAISALAISARIGTSDLGRRP